MSKICLLLIVMCSAVASAEGEPAKLRALSKSHPQYLKVKKPFSLSEKEAWERLVKAAKKDDKISTVFTRSKPWIIGTKYFFPREEVMKTFNKKFREWGVYVDGKTGKVEAVDTARKIQLK